MTDLMKKFSEAAKTVSSSKAPMWELVKQAYVDYLSDISTDDLPKEIQIFYDSVKLRITSGELFGHISNDEARYIANDIIYLAEVIISGLRKL
jgi:hypothetical protein